MNSKLLPITALAFAVFAFNACGWSSASRSNSLATTTALPPPVSLPPDDEATEGSIRFLEARVKNDPEDTIAYNKLAGYYLQRQRETGDVKYLELATRAARSSLGVIPADMNTGALAALTQAEYASHDFQSAREHAKELIKLTPRQTYGYQLLGDALLELGEYEDARAAFGQMEKGGSNVTMETRIARLAMLKGDAQAAALHYASALSRALEMVPASRETVAWCRWQLGETAFAVGDYEKAEQHYRDALTTFPDYYRALVGLGRARAARNDVPDAIEQYERAMRRLPDPTYVAALGDLYKLAGRERETNAQYALVEQIARLSALNGALYNRQLALFYADHDMKAQEAYELAAREYSARRDIYGADAVAWTALKAGKLDKAQAAIKEALRLGTEDARLFYHAGMIARAAGDQTSARKFLERALKLNPQFDPLQVPVAKKALAEIM